MDSHLYSRTWLLEFDRRGPWFHCLVATTGNTFTWQPHRSCVFRRVWHSVLYLILLSWPITVTACGLKKKTPLSVKFVATLHEAAYNLYKVQFHNRQSIGNHFFPLVTNYAKSICMKRRHITPIVPARALPDYAFQIKSPSKVRACRSRSTAELSQLRTRRAKR